MFNPTIGTLTYIRTKKCEDKFSEEQKLCEISLDETEEKNCGEKNECGHWSQWSDWTDSRYYWPQLF